MSGIGIYKCVKITLLLFMVLGYAAVYERHHRNLRFFPITLCAGITVALYICGFGGQLKNAAYAVFAVGCALFLMFCRKRQILAFFCEPSVVFCVLSTAWLYVATRGVMLSAWDDGSHWYRICKALSYEGGYPTTPDIIYYEYVPGTAIWIYFVTRFLDFSVEQVCLLMG